MRFNAAQFRQQKLLDVWCVVWPKLPALRGTNLCQVDDRLVVGASLLVNAQLFASKCASISMAGQ